MGLSAVITGELVLSDTVTEEQSGSFGAALLSWVFPLLWGSEALVPSLWEAFLVCA